MKKNFSRVTTALAFSCILMLIVVYPNASYKAAKDGVDIWFNNVLPALLPFFIGTELLIGLGVVHFLGVLLEPIMYPLFKVPGAGSFAFAMSITSGYPMGAKITSDLRNSRLCSRDEGQRLLALSSTSGPLFMIGAVAIGMFNNPFLGVIIALSHYIGSILTGLSFRKYGNKKRENFLDENINKNPFTALYHAREADGRKLGILLGDAVKNSVNTLLVIGGFIILFSVLIELFSTIRIFDFFSLVLSPLFSNINASHSLVKGLLSGILEITNGANIISQSNDSLIIQAVFTSFIIAWGGLSIHAQAISMISKTDLKIFPYIIAKIFHGCFAAISCYFLMKWLFPYFKTDIAPVFSEYSTIFFSEPNWSNKLLVSVEFYFSILLSLVVIGLLLSLLHSTKKLFAQKKS